MRVGLVLILVTAALAQDSVPDVLEGVLPGVVTIAIPKESTYAQGAGLAGSDIAYAKILDLGGVSGGSGFLIKHDGRFLIVTNAHVVLGAAEGSGSIEAFTIDQTRYIMRLAALDSLYDLAVLEFEAGSPGPEMKSLEFRTTDIRVGESVYAVGNPLLEFPYSVSSGIIGGKNRRHPDLTGKFGFLQSTATTTWGNSGGPLVDAKGHVAGIVTKIQFHPMGNQVYQQTQINLALDGRLAERLIDEMLSNGGRLRRAYFGVEISEDVEGSEPHRQVNPPIIAGVLRNSPAEKALEGRVGYRLRRVGSTEVGSTADALEAFERVRPGETIALELSAPGSANVEIVKVAAGELTDPNAAAIGQYMLAKARRKLLESGEGVSFEELATKPSSNAGLTERSQPAGRKTGAGPANGTSTDAGKTGKTHRVVAVGLYDDEMVRMYRVRNARDLGIAVKLTAMAGLVDILYLSSDQAEPTRLNITFSENPDILRRTLLY